MTLTDILPTLRGSLPDPLDRRLWPTGTHATLDDVVVQGLSLARAARLLRTPVLFRPPVSDNPVSDNPGSDTPASEVAVGVVLVTVEGISDSPDGPVIDCSRARLTSTVTVAAAETSWHETRLVGRVTLARRRPQSLRVCGVTRMVDLPTDLAPGDVLAVPTRLAPSADRGCRHLDRIVDDHTI